MNIAPDAYVIDAGNSSIKIGYFKNHEIISVERFSLEEFLQQNAIHQLIFDKPGILSSVLSNEDTTKIIKCIPSILVLNKLPNGITFNYTSAETLGKDRIANAFGALFLNPNKSSVVIDIGTCIKFDMLHNGEQYEGGSISPGIRLRYKSLNDYTGKLPLLNDTSSTELVGDSTYNSIHSGVINGIQCELDAMIQQYTKRFDNLTFFVTGGDAKYFDFHGKNNIFADINLTIKGLYQILALNGK